MIPSSARRRSSGLRSGLRFTPINFHLTAPEVQYILENSDAGVVFVGPETAEVGMEAATAAGVPLTVGFISKWYLLLAAAQQGWWWLAAIILISSLIAVVYIWRIVEVAYFKPVSNAAKGAVEAPLGLLLPTWVLVVLNVYFGIDATWTAGMAHQIAAALLGTPG